MWPITHCTVTKILYWRISQDFVLDFRFFTIINPQRFLYRVTVWQVLLKFGKEVCHENVFYTPHFQETELAMRSHIPLWKPDCKWPLLTGSSYSWSHTNNYSEMVKVNGLNSARHCKCVWGSGVWRQRNTHSFPQHYIDVCWASRSSRFIPIQ